MNQEWSLDVLYRGYEDPKFDEDMKKFESEVAGMKEKIEAAKKLDPVKGLETCLMVKEEMAALWANGTMTQEKFDSFATLHERTPYRK